MDLRNFLSEEKRLLSFRPPHCFELCGKTYDGIAFDAYPSREAVVGGKKTAYTCFKSADGLYIVAFDDSQTPVPFVLDAQSVLYPSPASDGAYSPDLAGNTVDWTFGTAPGSTVRVKFTSETDNTAAQISFPKQGGEPEACAYRAFALREGVYVIGISSWHGGKPYSTTVIADFTCDLASGFTVCEGKAVTPVGCYAQHISYEN